MRAILRTMTAALMTAALMTATSPTKRSGRATVDRRPAGAHPARLPVMGLGCLQNGSQGPRLAVEAAGEATRNPDPGRPQLLGQV